MTISANTVWEVRSTGSDSSGGGFVAGASGTDRSQSDTAFANGTNLTVDSSTNTDVAPDSYSPVAADIGNIIQITTTGGGAAFTIGAYEIKSIQSGKWRLDRSPAATSSAGATWAMGGAIATYSKLSSLMIANNKAFIKGTFTSPTTTTFTLSASPQTTEAPTSLIGYSSVRGDNGRSILTLQTNSNLKALVLSGNGFYVANLDIDCANLTGGMGIDGSGSSRSVVINCKVSNFKARAIQFNGQYCTVQGCEITGGNCDIGVSVNSGLSYVTGCYFHDNTLTTAAIAPSFGCAVMHNLIVNNTTGKGILSADGTCVVIMNNTIYNCGSHGINIGNTRESTIVMGNLLVNNAGYGIKWDESNFAQRLLDGNAYYNNTLGTRNNIDRTDGIYGVGAYTNSFDVTLTGDPFVNAAGLNFSLNSTVGAGASARGRGALGTFPGSTGIDYSDFGCLQHKSDGYALIGPGPAYGG